MRLARFVNNGLTAAGWTKGDEHPNNYSLGSSSCLLGIAFSATLGPPKSTLGHVQIERNRPLNLKSLCPL
jgi:hypothetical protein